MKQYKGMNNSSQLTTKKNKILNIKHKIFDSIYYSLPITFFVNA